MYSYMATNAVSFRLKEAGGVLEDQSLAFIVGTENQYSTFFM